jgi:hypothetical protein
MEAIMGSLSYSLIIVISIATLFVLIAGIVFMAKGGKLNAKYSNKLMTMRVMLQAVAIIIAVIAYAAFKK